MREYRLNSQDRVLANIRMAVLQTLTGRGEQWLEELRLTNLAQEAEGSAADVLICMEEVIPDAIAASVSTPSELEYSIIKYRPDQNHLLLQLPARIVLWAYLVVEVQQLLERLALARHDEPDDVHQQLRHRVAVQHDNQDPAHSVQLRFIGALFQLLLELLDRRLVRGIVEVHNRVRVFKERRHVCGGSLSLASSS